MALNYPSYLLASSPPGFELLSDRWLDSKATRSTGFNSYPSNNNSVPSESASVSKSDKTLNDLNLNNGNNNDNINKGFEYKDARLETTRDRELDKNRILEWEQSYNWDLSEFALCLDGSKNEKITRKISFADELGKDLIQVKMAAEPSDVPPTLNSETIQKIQRTLVDAFIDDDNDVIQNSCQTNWEPEYKLILVNFMEPHLNLLALHNRIEQINVSLASISTRVGCLICGTIETKRCLSEISNKKQVTLRYTLDGWKNSVDICCKYVSAVGGTNHELFSFEFALNEIEFQKNYSCDQHIEVEFAICYISEMGQEYWDNNNNQNYKIICQSSNVANFTHNNFYTLDSINSNDHYQIVPAQSPNICSWNLHDFESDFDHPYW